MGKQIADFKIRMRDLFVLNFETNSKNIKSLIKQPQEYIIEINVGHKLLINEGAALIDVNVIVFVDKDKKVDLCKISTRMIYDILTFEKYPKDEKGHHIFFRDFIAHLIEISYSTTRGILFGKLSDTILNNLKLPLIESRKFAENLGKSISQEKPKTDLKTNKKIKLRS